MTPLTDIFTKHYIIVFFLVVNLLVGLWAGFHAKVRNFHEYAMASRRLPTGVLVMTILGTYVASEFVSYPSYFFEYGFVQLVFAIVQVSFFWLIGTFIAPCLVYFYDCNTLGEVMGKLYGRFVQLTVSLMGIFSALLVIAAQIRAMGMLGEELLGLSSWSAIIFFGLLIVLYSTIGGMRAVSYTDVLQLVLAFMVFGWVTQKVIGEVGNLWTLFHRLYEEHPEKVKFYTAKNFVRTVKKGVFYDFSGAFLLSLPMVQRMLMVREKGRVRRMWYVSSFLAAFIWVMVMVIGLGALVANVEFVSGNENKDILFHLIWFFFRDNKWMLDFMFLGVLGILFSTTDSYLHAASISFVSDVMEPMKFYLSGVPLERDRKVDYARGGVLVIGIFAVVFAYFGGASVITKGFYQFVVVVSSLFMVPFVVGVLGVKTDMLSWVVFCVGYMMTFLGLQWWGWEIYDAFLVGVPVGVLMFFLMHVYVNGGVVTLARDQSRVSERLWLSSWDDIKCGLRRVLGWVVSLPKLARLRVVNTPIPSLAFSIVTFGLYTLSVLNGGSGTGLKFMVLHIIGLGLCCGLMLRGVWPDRLQPYFAFYWFVTVLYCLPFGSTLALLKAPQEPFVVVLWVSSFVLLGYAVDSTSFVCLSFWGTGLALAGWRVLKGSFPINLWDFYRFVALFVVIMVFIGIVLFGRGKESYVKERILWNRVASNALAHELRHTAGTLGLIGEVMKSSFEESGELTKEKQAFFKGFYETIIRKSRQGKQEITDFTRFIEQQAFGVFEQEAVSVRDVVEEGVGRLEEGLANSLKVDVLCVKDFHARLLPGMFPNVIANMIRNACLHGRASEVVIKIDGNVGKVYVCDNGRGIPPHVLPRIFDLHYTTVDDGRDGSGVGLAFVKMVVVSCGGSIVCHSRYGDSDSFTEFVIDLPVA